jgi:large subunit ribosomal protein L29
MAILKKKELKNQKELSTKLTELQLELAKERASIAIGASVTSPGKIREIRRTIAAILNTKKEVKQ